MKQYFACESQHQHGGIDKTYIHQVLSLAETNVAPKNWWLEDEIKKNPFWDGLFSRANC